MPTLANQLFENVKTFISLFLFLYSNQALFLVITRWTDAVYEGAQDRLRIQGFVSVETKAMKPAASTHLFKVGSSFSRGEVFSCQKTLAERFYENAKGSAELRSEASQPSLHSAEPYTALLGLRGAGEGVRKRTPLG